MSEWKRYKNSNYFISKTGKVYNEKTEILLKESVNQAGYVRYTLRIDNKNYSKLAHSLVIESWLNITLTTSDLVNHIDGNKTNNRVDNLEWCTDSENMIHAFKNGLVNNRTETKIKSCYININKATNKNKIKIYQYDKNGNYVNKYNSIIEASKLNGINATHISLCAKGKQKTCGGYIWKYEGLVYD